MTTHLTWRKCWRKIQPGRIAWSVSGVVINTSGGLRDCFMRSLVSVSPCRTASLMSRLLHHHSSLSRRSLFRARRGVT